jgi:predicted dehydrogenase
MDRIAFAQWGVQHGHAAGKALALRANPATDLRGVYEADPEIRARAEADPAYAGLHWYRDPEEFLDDREIVAVAVEGRNAESLPQARACVDARKHVWWDKPAGDDWSGFQWIAAAAEQHELVLQLGYMFRYHDGFNLIARLARDGGLGDVFGVRAHMSTSIPVRAWPSNNTREAIASHVGGMLFDLGGHMLDQVLWVMRDERPLHVSRFLRNDATPEVPAFADNTLGVFQFARAMATVDIAAMEVAPPARRFEVYGTLGTAIMEPFEPANALHLNLARPWGEWEAGVHRVPLLGLGRQRLYELEVQGLIPALRGEAEPDRPLTHEVVVQETLLRGTGSIGD